MEVKRFEFNPFGENTYIIWDTISKDAAIIDPGMVELYEMEQVETFVNNAKMNLKFILLTHMHIDHTFGIEMLKERFGDIPSLAHKADAHWGQSRQLQADMFHLRLKLNPLDADRYISENTELKIGDEEITVIHTPGHSMGGLCYYTPKSGIIFTGDTLFRGSIGRTDFPGGSHSQIIQSIRTKLLCLPAGTKVYPGHGPSTTIDTEAVSNPYIQ